MATPTSQDGAVPPDVAARLRAVPSFAATTWSAAPLDGGLTNHNFRVTTPDGVFVARLSSPDGALLAIDREVEYLASVAASTTGIAPRVVDYVPEVGVLVITWVQGRTCTEDDLREGSVLPRVVDALRRLHSGPRFPTEFDMFEIQRGYLNVVQERGFRLPPRYLEFQPVVDRIRGALAVQDEGTVPCHNDLLAANLIDDGEKVWVIDYEYAGNNDPCFELGNLWSESVLAPEQLEEIIALYYGKPLRHKVARARLLGLMAKYGWMLWASIQDGVSPLDFDFWSWGMEKYDRAVAEFDGPDLERWIGEAQRDD